MNTFHLVPRTLTAECFFCFSEIQTCEAYNVFSHSKTWLRTREEFTHALRLNKLHVIKINECKRLLWVYCDWTFSSMQQHCKICNCTLTIFFSLDEWLSAKVICHGFIILFLAFTGVAKILIQVFVHVFYLILGSYRFLVYVQKSTINKYLGNGASTPPPLTQQ